MRVRRATLERNQGHFILLSFKQGRRSLMPPQQRGPVAGSPGLGRVNLKISASGYTIPDFAVAFHRYNIGQSTVTGEKLAG